MLLDERLEIADAASVAAVAGDAVIGDSIDLGAPGYGGVANITNFAGDGTPIYFMITVDTQIITGGSPGLIQFFLVSDDVTPVVAGGSTTHIASQILITDDATVINTGIAAGDLAYVGNTPGGVLVCQALPMGLRYLRYLGVLATITTTTVTAGKINAFLTREPNRYRMYPDSLPSGS